MIHTPLVPNNLEPKAPEGPHLAVVTGPEEVLALPRGAQMFIVSDPDRPDRTVPVMLVAVNRKSLVFRCLCKNPKCTRVLRYTLKVEGFHPEK